jgi:hypothetical protein
MLEEWHKSCILSVQDKHEIIWGTAFLIAPYIAVTCAHVINKCRGEVGESIKVVLPHNDESFTTAVIPELWDEYYDIAFLNFENLKLSKHRFLPICDSNLSAIGKIIRSFGFPSVKTKGLWGMGEVIGQTQDEIGRELLQIDSTEITSGFSGAPVWIEQFSCVIGMITDVIKPDKYDRMGRVAFALPTSIILKILSKVQPVYGFEYDAFREIQTLAINIQTGIIDIHRLQSQVRPSKPGTIVACNRVRSDIERFKEVSTFFDQHSYYENNTWVDSFRAASSYAISLSGRYIDVLLKSVPGRRVAPQKTVVEG